MSNVQNSWKVMRPMTSLLGLFIIGLVIAACRSAPEPTASIPALENGTPEVDETAVATPEEILPTPTTSPNGVVLLAPAGSDPAFSLEIQDLLMELSAQDGLEFETRTEFDRVELDPTVRIMVVLPPDPGLANLAAANPDVQFLAVGIPDLKAAGNLSVIDVEAGLPDQQGFLAGYLASVITSDWRVGVISRSDTPAGKAARLGFMNGVIYFCGLCRPAYPPFVQYPIAVDISGSSEQAAQQAAADQLIANAVQTVFIGPEAGDLVLLEYLSQAGLNMIGSGSPPDSLRPNWVASIRSDPAEAVRQIWPDLAAGKGGSLLKAPLAISNVNPELLSEGRQRLVEQMLSDLVEGYIDTRVDPETGEPRS